MMEYLRKDKWSPYVTGTLIGLLLTLLFHFGQALGASSGVARISALLVYAAAPAHIESTPFFSKLLSDKVLFDWRVLVIAGIFLGALLASKLTTEAPPQKNTIWKQAFGPSKAKRYGAAFFGGLLLLFGARLAGGCTSGHAITGGAQLSITSWIFMLSLFATAIPTAFALYKHK